MAKIIELTQKPNANDFVPVEEWDGECWKIFFEEFCVPNGDANGVSPWEYLANFIKMINGGK